MARRNESAVRKVLRRGVRRLVIDFRYVDRDGRARRYRRDASVQTWAAAVAEARRLRGQVAESGHLEVRAPGVTLAAFVGDHYRRDYMPRFRPATRERYEVLLATHVLPRLGDLELRDVSPELRRFAVGLTERGIQLKGPVSLVRSILRAAVEAKELPAMPALPRLWKEPRKLPDAPSENEVAQALEGATGWLRVAIALAARAGLRSGEVRALEVRDVDLEHGVIKVRRAFSGDDVVAPKSGDEREVPIAADLRPILDVAVKAKLPKARLVVNDRGRTPTRQNVLTALKNLQRRLGLPSRSFHSLRHFFCSTLVRRGASLEAVRILAGHADLATTQRYVHADVGDLAGAIARLG